MIKTSSKLGMKKIARKYNMKGHYSSDVAYALDYDAESAHRIVKCNSTNNYIQIDNTSYYMFQYVFNLSLSSPRQLEDGSGFITVKTLVDKGVFEDSYIKIENAHGKCVQYFIQDAFEVLLIDDTDIDYDFPEECLDTIINILNQLTIEDYVYLYAYKLLLE